MAIINKEKVDVRSLFSQLLKEVICEVHNSSDAYENIIYTFNMAEKQCLNQNSHPFEHLQ